MCPENQDSMMGKGGGRGEVGGGRVALPSLLKWFFCPLSKSIGWSFPGDLCSVAGKTTQRAGWPREARGLIYLPRMMFLVIHFWQTRQTHLGDLLEVQHLGAQHQFLLPEPARMARSGGRNQLVPQEFHTDGCEDSFKLT